MIGLMSLAKKKTATITLIIIFGQQVKLATHPWTGGLLSGRPREMTHQQKYEIMRKSYKNEASDEHH